MKTFRRDYFKLCFKGSKEDLRLILIVYVLAADPNRFFVLHHVNLTSLGSTEKHAEMSIVEYLPVLQVLWGFSFK